MLLISVSAYGDETDSKYKIKGIHQKTKISQNVDVGFDWVKYRYDLYIGTKKVKFLVRNKINKEFKENFYIATKWRF